MWMLFDTMRLRGLWMDSRCSPDPVDPTSASVSPAARSNEMSRSPADAFDGYENDTWRNETAAPFDGSVRRRGGALGASATSGVTERIEESEPRSTTA